MILTRMIGQVLSAALVPAACVAPPAAAEPPSASGVSGMDVSDHQADVDWAKAWTDGARFAYIKATEGTNFRSDAFDRQYRGAQAVGMVRGAYHVALPDRSTGAAQAVYFLRRGGGWTPDGRTLPGAVDVEPNPYGDFCYGLTPQQISAWLADFSAAYHQHTHRYPAIYTTAAWWDRCTGHNPTFADQHPLWLAHYAATPGGLPAGWSFPTIWQFADSGTLPGDQNTFTGSLQQLLRFAR